MTEALDKVLAAADLHDRTYKLARTWGASEELAEVFASAKKTEFAWDGVNLLWRGKTAADGEDCKAHFTKGPLAALFPKTEASAPNIDPQLLASARAGNQTARTQIYKQVGDIATTDKLIADKSDAAVIAAAADSANPWRAANFRTDKTAQAEAARLIKALGTEAAARMAKSAGRTLDGRELKAA